MCIMDQRSKVKSLGIVLGQDYDEVAVVDGLVQRQRDGLVPPLVQVRHLRRRRHHRDPDGLLGQLQANTNTACNSFKPDHTFQKYLLIYPRKHSLVSSF